MRLTTTIVANGQCLCNDNTASMSEQSDEKRDRRILPSSVMGERRAVDGCVVSRSQSYHF